MGQALQDVEVLKNPDQGAIKALMAGSEQQAVKWVRDNGTGNIYYWKAEEAQHAEIALMLKLKIFSKGVEVSKA